MFDKAIIDTDKFMDMSLTTKALYFLLGMEADDYGFVSYKKVMRTHGGNEDDIGVLLAKGFLIMFKSQVVVITDWNSNNYLNKHRLKPTEYPEEYAQLFINPGGKYQIGSAPSALGSGDKKLTPGQFARDFFDMQDNYHSLLEEFSTGNDANLVSTEFKKFVLYWTESNRSGTKVRWELQSVFDVKRRLYTWFSKHREFNSPSFSKTQPIAFT